MKGLAVNCQCCSVTTWQLQYGIARVSRMHDGLSVKGDVRTWYMPVKGCI